jgi:CRP/FNR family cyclic AMP-dependent transcriptional regulator
MVGDAAAIDVATAPDDALINPSLVRIQAMADTRLLWIRAATLRDLAQTEISVAWLLIEQLARSRRDLMRSFVGMMFGSVRQRVAKHLLELTRGQDPAVGLLVPIRQRELADAVGSTREVVARALRDLRACGFIATSPRGVRLLDPDGLRADADAAYFL